MMGSAVYKHHFYGLNIDIVKSIKTDFYQTCIASTMHCKTETTDSRFRVKGQALGGIKCAVNRILTYTNGTSRVKDEHDWFGSEGLRSWQNRVSTTARNLLEFY